MGDGSCSAAEALANHGLRLATGHSCDDGVTLDTYSHALPGMQEKAVNAITKMLLHESIKELQRAASRV
jgi:hypothetical protein